MTAKNDITNDLIKTRVASQKYIDNYDSIFRKTNENFTDTITNSSTSNGIEQGEEPSFEDN